MKFIFNGRNITVSDQMKSSTEKKMKRLERLLPADAEITVTFTVIRSDNTVEVTIPLQRRILRAEETAGDMYTALDSIMDILEKQMVKYKKRIRDKSRKDVSFKDELSYMPADAAEDDLSESDHEIVIKKTKKFALKPMDADEAVMEMEMLGHGFFVFRNGRSDEVNVVYKRKDGTYGLIEPEF